MGKRIFFFFLAAILVFVASSVPPALAGKGDTGSPVGEPAVVREGPNGPAPGPGPVQKGPRPNRPEPPAPKPEPVPTREPKPADDGKDAVTATGPTCPLSQVEITWDATCTCSATLRVQVQEAVTVTVTLDGQATVYTVAPGELLQLDFQLEETTRTLEVLVVEGDELIYSSFSLLPACGSNSQ